MTTNKKKTQKSKEYQTLENLCQQNNIDIKNVKNIGGKVKELEMFFGGYPELIGLRFFTSLSMLKLIGQDINNLASLKFVSHSLKELWICESKIQKLDGLETCIKLKKLYLYNNAIKDCTQISSLVDLEILWLNNNQIVSLQFMEKLFFLNEVNFAKNLITDESMKEVHCWPPNLVILNMSMNNIHELKSLLTLTLTKRLTSLCFAHPMYGACPLCKNPYYVSWILYHFEKVTVLDGIEIKNSNPAKKKAVKLKLEIECKLRSAENKTLETQQKIVENFIRYHEVVVAQIRYLSQIINFRRSKSNLDYTLTNLEDRRQFWITLFDRLHSVRYKLTSLFQLATELQRMKLHVCLETCSANSVKDTLVPHIINFATNFYCPQQMAFLDITGFKIHDCVQLTENQQLDPGQLFFVVDDKPLTSDFVWSLRSNVRPLDDCFFVQNFFLLAMKFSRKDGGSHLCSLIAVKVPESCRKTKLICNIKDFEHKKVGKNDKVSLKCDCTEKKIYHRVENVKISGDYEMVALITIEFINVKFSCFTSETLIDGAEAEFLKENIESDKSLLSKSDNFTIVSQLPTETLQSDNLTSLILFYNTIEDLSPLDKLNKLTCLNLSFNNVRTLTSLKSLQKLEELYVEGNCLMHWFAELNHLKFFCSKLKKLNFQHNLWSFDEENLAEVFANTFLINLIECNAKSIDKVKTALTFEELSDPTFVDRMWNVTDLPLLLNCENWMNLLIRFGCQPITLDLLDNNKWCSVITGLNLETLSLLSLQKLGDLPKLKFLTLNKIPITDITNLSSLSRLEVLHLDFCCVEKFPNLRLVNLTVLSLRFNKLSDMSFSKHVTQLTKLDLTGNNIVSLDDVHYLTQLREIILARNRIANVQDVKTLKTIDTLAVVDLTGNDVQQLPHYRSYSIHLLKNIEVLDHSLVSEEERKHCDETFGRTLSLDFLTSRYDSTELGRIIHLKLTQLGLHSTSLPADNNLSHILTLDLTENKFKYIGDIVNLKNLERLVLSSNCFQRVFQTEPQEETKYLTHLKVLHLDQNGISKMQNLQLSYLQTLTELYLQNNKVIHVQGLDGLINLEVLDLSYNKISSLSPHSFAKQIKLKYLSLAYNRLKDLTHLNKLESLEHLDVSFNSVHSLQKIKSMESLRNLKTFKCTGNPVCKRNVYEHIIVSHFPNLQTIDEKTLSDGDKQLSMTTVEANKKPLLKTTNVKHSFGDEEDEKNNNSTVVGINKKFVTLPLLKTTYSFPNNFLSEKPKPAFKRKLGENQRTQRVDALNLAVNRVQEDSDSSRAKKGFQIFGRPCSIERRICKKK